MRRDSARALMIQGTGSDVGKSLLVAGLARAFVLRGHRVRPFKPQNMSNNAAVARTADGGMGEIGRAQALQARAALVEPSVDMNPVLLKPTTDQGSQVVVQGRVLKTVSARDYQSLKGSLLPSVLESFARMRAEADLVLVEGAGSAAEMNLRAGDIANMGFATAADVPVVLVGDVERGGVLASLVGTYALLPEAERRRVAGYIVNKFRGDASLFADADRLIEARTGWRSFGIVTHFPEARHLPKEDSYALDSTPPSAGSSRAGITVAVLRLERIANFDDIDPLAAEPGVRLRMIAVGEPIPGDAHVVLIPGTKSTLGDLRFLRAQGWDVDLAAHVRRGGVVVGLCGGFQMLGSRVLDPDGHDGAAGTEAGLGLLDLQTTMVATKTVGAADAVEIASGEAVRGYEIHMGRTDGAALARPWLRHADGRTEGAISTDGKIMGCYVHGLFAADGFRRAFLARLGASAGSSVGYTALVETTLDRLAAHLESCLDLDALWRAARQV